MSGTFSRFFIFSLFSASLVLTGCSGGGGDAGVATPLYSGATTPAAITQSNADEVAQKSTEGINEAVDLTATGDAIPFFPIAVDVSSNTDALVQTVGGIVLDVLDDTVSLNLPVAATITADQLNGGSTGQFCGGSISVPDNIDQNATSQDITMGFHSLCFDDGINRMTLNGSLRFIMNSTEVSITFTNFIVNMDGRQESFSGVFSCDANMAGCTIATDYAGSDGNVYRLADVNISGDAQFGYDVGATFYHHELGRVTIATTSVVTYGGCGIYPSGGIITVSSSDGSNITVSFSDCSYTITGVDANAASISATGSWT